MAVIFSNTEKFARILGWLDQAEMNRLTDTEKAAIINAKKNALLALKDLGLKSEETEKETANGPVLITNMMINGRKYSFEELQSDKPLAIDFGVDEMFMDEGEIELTSNGKLITLHFVVAPIFDADEILVFLEKDGRYKSAVSKNGIATIRAFGFVLEFHGSIQNGEYSTEIYLLENSADAMSVGLSPYRPDRESKGHIILHSGSEEIHIVPLLSDLGYSVPDVIVWVKGNRENRPFFLWSKPDTNKMEIRLGDGSSYYLSGGYDEESDSFAYIASKEKKTA